MCVYGGEYCCVNWACYGFLLVCFDVEGYVDEGVVFCVVGYMVLIEL